MNEVKKFFSQKKMYLILSVLFLVAIGLVVGIVVLNSQEKDELSGEGMTEEEMDAEAEAFAIQEEESERNNYISTDDYYKEMDEIITRAETKEEKSQLYIERAEELYARQASEERDLTKMILADVYKAEEVAPSADTAWMIYLVESNIGDGEKAETYLEIAKKRGYKEEDGNG